MKKLFYVLALVVTLTWAAEEPTTKCSTKWLSGYRLSSAQPQKTLLNLSLKDCEDECVGFAGGVANGCAAFAFGTLPPYNNTCELAIAPLQSPRSSRAVNGSINMSAVDKSPPWDVYVLSRDRDGCGKRSYLFEQPMTNVPIDCFYRLLSGKRLSKPNALKSISVSSLPECQDACIRESSFQCRSVSYRYMPSGYSYPVANCELSPFYIMTTSSSSQSQTSHDFVDDFDYDYFQREPYCKTTGGGGGGGAYGVCAVVVRRGGRMAPFLIKSSHQVTTPSQCEHLCTTSTFRCRAFAFRHTDRGHTSHNRDPFHRHPSSSQTNPNTPCQLYESELSRIPSSNIEADPDFDLYEMGRLMGAECMLQGQWGSSNRYRPVTSTASAPVGDWYGQNRERDYYGQNSRYPAYPTTGRYPTGGMSIYDRDRDRYNERYPERPSDREGGYYYDRPMNNHNYNQGSSGGSSGSLLPGDRTNYFEKYPVSSSFDHDKNRFPTPGIGGGGDKRFDTDRGGSSSSSGGLNNVNDRWPSPPEQIEKPMNQGPSQGHSLHHYEKEPPVPMKGHHSVGGGGHGASSGSSGSAGDVKGCLIRLHTRPDAHLVPELARATFPVKTLEECSMECMRSLEVLRFPCRVMAFRFTSHTGGTCQLSATPGHTLRDQDFISSQHQGHHHRENGVVFVYDETVSGCQRPVDHRQYDSNRRVDDWGSGRYGSSSGSGSGGGWYAGQGHSDRRDYYGSNYGSSNYGSSNYGSNNYGSNYGSSYNRPSYNTPFQTTPQQFYQHQYNQAPLPNRHTVDGEPCLHSCVRNADAGFYYCQTDREGAWNFCCRPDDGQCGYSRGLSFAWCYVGTGPSRDVWRTCKRTPSGPPAQYIHNGNPPEVVRLKGEQPLGNLTVGDVGDLLERQEVSKSQVVEIKNDSSNDTTVVLKE